MEAFKGMVENLSLSPLELVDLILSKRMFGNDDVRKEVARQIMLRYNESGVLPKDISGYCEAVASRRVVTVPK